ncbi:MAG: hypothetical protein JXA83_05565 [Acidimicrobiales bacterium]|nr:hypothetical protein [Acidimicrobiales bacterium]
MAEDRPQDRSTGRGLVGVIVAAVVLVLGVAIAVAGSTAASRADDDLDEARAELPELQDERDAAVDERDAAEARLADAQSEVADVEARATTALDASTDLCDCDQRRSELFDTLRTAFDANDLASANAAIDELNAEGDTADTALATLREAAGTDLFGEPASTGG